MTDNSKFMLSAEYMNDYSVPQYTTKVELSDHPMSYSEASTFGYVATAAGNAMANMGLCTAATTSHPQLLTTMDHLLPETAMTARPAAMTSTVTTTTTQPQQGSPDTPMSSLASCCTSPAPVALLNTTMATTPLLGPFLPYSPTSPNTSPSPCLIQPHHASTTSSSLTETLNRATSFPEAFYPEFLQYSKETYEQSTGPNRKKRRYNPSTSSASSSSSSSSSSSAASPARFSPTKIEAPTSPVKAESPATTPKEERKNTSNDWENPQQYTTTLSNSEIRRQIHIQSEQKRRAQIKDGFEDLRNELPSCLNKKMSKVALLHRTVQHIQHLKSTQVTIMANLRRLMAENEQLRKFQESVLQKQAMEKMYQINTL